MLDKIRVLEYCAINRTRYIAMSLLRTVLPWPKVENTEDIVRVSISKLLAVETGGCFIVSLSPTCFVGAFVAPLTTSVPTQPLVFGAAAQSTFTAMPFWQARHVAVMAMQHTLALGLFVGTRVLVARLHSPPPPDVEIA